MNIIKLSPSIEDRRAALLSEYDTQSTDAHPAIRFLSRLERDIEEAISIAKQCALNELQSLKDEGATDAELDRLYTVLNDAFIGTVLNSARKAIRAEPHIYQSFSI